MEQVHVLDMKDRDVTHDMSQEMSNLWARECFGNDDYYFRWYRDDNMMGEDFGDEFPHLHTYLMNSGVEKCLIRYWW